MLQLSLASIGGSLFPDLCVSPGEQGIGNKEESFLITQLPNYPITQLPNYPITQLPNSTFSDRKKIGYKPRPSRTAL
ncbi:hypothetical protein [Dolichospermum flos-aquae]|uniref:Uncharacterized protein n=1 Tax=Dolichospermum flos-aquae LEGE 04289 TaxID=1828708 RepID=A0ACC5Q3P8_DOLFA|nr:hypothetical protein [Dolichospermum flos-aquae]MBE9218410.1 hypothetical protein [Dolichospermum flos-aquae LEGE 04289]